MAAAQFTSSRAHTGDAPRAGVVAAHELAARAGAEMLESGGNAADAAASVAAVLGVVDPANCGVGGYGGLAVLMDDVRSGAMQVDFNAVVPGTYPAAGRATDAPGALVSPPAVVPGLCALQARFGRLGAGDVWAPAIRIARDGFAVGEDLAAALRWAQGKHRGLNDAFRRVFMAGGEPPRAGQLLRQPQLAQTLERVAAQGGGAMASGAIAESICTTVRESGGYLVPADLAAVEAQVAQASEQRFGDARVWGPDPERCGTSILFAALRGLQGAGLGEQRSEQYIAALTRALTDAWRARNARYQPLARIATQTTHLCTGDRDGMLVSMTFTHGPTWFGSGLLAEDTGVILNTGALIFARRASDGALVAQPHLSPVIMHHGDATYALGTPGGTRIPAIVLQAIVDLVHYRISPREALAGARVSADADGICEGEAALAARFPALGLREIRTREYFGPASGIARSAGRMVAMLDPRFQGACAYVP